LNAAELELVDGVRALARGEFAERAAATDRDRAFPAENVDALRQLGVTAMLLDAKFGGLGMGPEALVRVMEEIAWADGSTAVALNMHLLIAHFLAFLPMFPHGERVLTDMGRNGALICGPGSVPTGDLDNRKSGFTFSEQGDALIVNGKAGFASMSEGASYALVGGWIERAGGEPDVVIAVPRLDSPGIRNLRNWNAMGMRGTASHDIAIEGLAIPRAEAFRLPLALAREGQRQLSVEMIKQRSWGALGILGIWVGLSQAAYDATLAYVRERHGYLAGQTTGTAEVGFRADEAWAQTGIGRMDHWLGTGRVVLNDTVRCLSEPGGDPQEFVRRMVRTVFHLRRMSEEIAQDSLRICGAHAYVSGRPLERIFRDLVGANVMAWKTDQLVQMLGLGALGREITLAGPAGT
jgi:alkylation response protein AidB-like acyl-CoA dehydrogenase